MWETAERNKVESTYQSFNPVVIESAHSTGFELCESAQIVSLVVEEEEGKKKTATRKKGDSVFTQKTLELIRNPQHQRERRIPRCYQV